MTIGFNTLRAVETLTEAGIAAPHAKAIVSTMHDVVEHLATKADVAELRTATKADIAELRAETKADVAALRAETKADIAALRAETKADIAALRAETRAGFADLRREIANVQAALTWRIVLALGVFAALSRLAI